ncbi:MAG: hypothetical protein HC800_20200 [Phormidesmis sp. RL_2_1]|nr:hypothetical protein [Phormidesmis sp. RL_2_1]
MYRLSIRAVPKQMALVARAAFPKGNPYLTLRDELGSVFEDSDFEELFATVGQQYPTVFDTIGQNGKK